MSTSPVHENSQLTNLCTSHDNVQKVCFSSTRVSDDFSESHSDLFFRNLRKYRYGGGENSPFKVSWTPPIGSVFMAFSTAREKSRLWKVDEFILSAYLRNLLLVFVLVPKMHQVSFSGFMFFWTLTKEGMEKSIPVLQDNTARTLLVHRCIDGILFGIPLKFTSSCRNVKMSTKLVMVEKHGITGNESTPSNVSINLESQKVLRVRSTTDSRCKHYKERTCKNKKRRVAPYPSPEARSPQAYSPHTPTSRMSLWPVAFGPFIPPVEEKEDVFLDKSIGERSTSVAISLETKACDDEFVDYGTHREERASSTRRHIDFDENNSNPAPRNRDRSELPDFLKKFGGDSTH